MDFHLNSVKKIRLDMKNLLLNFYKYSFETGQLSITLKNWHLYSLLNQDFKILAKLVAERIKTALPYLIDQDQTEILEGRYIGQNIVNILDIIHHTEVQEIPALLISIDLDAFDKPEWSFMLKCLEYFGFPNYIKHWLKKTQSQIMLGNPNISIPDVGFDKASLCHHISSFYVQKFSLCRHVLHNDK